MPTHFTASYGRIRLYSVIIPLSLVQEIELGDKSIYFYYIGGNGNYNKISFESNEQRDEVLESVNKHLKKITYDLRNTTYTPNLGWKDLTPKPPVDEVTVDTQEQTEETSVAEEPPAEPPAELEPKDDRPWYTKIFS